MNKIVIKILQGSVVTQTMLGGLTALSCCKFLILYMPNIMKIRWQKTKLLQ